MREISCDEQARIVKAPVGRDIGVSIRSRSLEHFDGVRVNRQRRYERYSYQGPPKRNWLLFSTGVLLIGINCMVASLPYAASKVRALDDPIYTENQSGMLYGSFDVNGKRWVRGSQSASNMVSSWIPSNLIA